MHSLLASPTWKQLGYVEKVKNDQVILCVRNLIQYNMTSAELLSRQYWILTNTTPKSCKKICLSLDRTLHLGGETKLVSPAARETLMLYVVRTAW